MLLFLELGKCVCYFFIHELENDVSMSRNFKEKALKFAWKTLLNSRKNDITLYTSFCHYHWFFH